MIQVVACSVIPHGDRLPKNLIEALSAFGMRSYMRNDPAKERARERLVTVEHEKSDMWREG